MARQLFIRRSSDQQDAGVLRGAVPHVEINYTFYRMPTEKLLAGWAQGTPEAFTFTLKAPRRITHDSKLQHCRGPDADVLPDRAHARPQARRPALSAAAELQEGRRRVRRVPRRRCPRARAPRSSSATSRGSTRRSSTRCAAQPRALRRRQREDEHAGRRRPPTTPTSACATRAISRPISSAGHPSIQRATRPRRDAFVYFKHEEEGKGPEFAKRLSARLVSSGHNVCG